MSTPSATEHGPLRGKELAKVSIAALGVVYGDIGTSPLYALKECFDPTHGVQVTPANVLGILSLVFWSLTLVVVLKYLTFVMRADNQGEGGILALLALLKPKPGVAPTAGFRKLALLALFGAALLYGDGMITPSLSVLSAIEGLDVKKIPPLHIHVFSIDEVIEFKSFIVPITLVVLLTLFLAQKRGTAKIGAIFGPAMLLWFATLALAGLPWIARNTSVLQAILPHHAVRFMVEHKTHGFLVLGSVVLCITGGEALYADMGHFGCKPIRLAWYAVVFPALLLNYFGQGALLLADPTAAEQPFFRMVPEWAVYPLVAIATFATVVASQALISGAFSLTQQAVQLGYWPRVTIVHTSGDAEGQIYIPEINNLLLVCCICLVVGFGSSTALAAAYGIAVTGTMAVTSLLFYVVATERWHWPKSKAAPLVALFLVVDLAFFFANATKIHKGGWFPLAIAAVVMIVMVTWKRGREMLADAIRGVTLPLDVFLADVEAIKPLRVRGLAVFMTSNPDGAPPVLLHHFKHNKMLHERVALLSIATRHQPEVAAADRIERIRDLGHGFYQITAVYGFMQTPNVQELMLACAEVEPALLSNDTSFFLGRETLLVRDNGKMARWRKNLFIFLSRNARPANAFFQIPPNRVIELGTQIEL
jgi:KUP system potassium uptake protein